jgi:hypothetical protein
MQTRNVLIWGGAAMLLLLGAAYWVLLQPPRGHAQTAGQLSASNPALELRYHYDPGIFHPAPYDPRAEFPLRLDAADWSFYGKRLQGLGTGLVDQPPPDVYSVVNDANTAVYREFYKLEQEGESEYQIVQLANLQALRQRLTLRLGPDSRGWPAYFPPSVRGDKTYRLTLPNPNADKAFGGIPEVEQMKRKAAENTDPKTAPERAYIYGWALFNKQDLYFFQAISARPLDERELGDIEAMIGTMEYGALLAQPAPAAPPATEPGEPGTPATTPPPGTPQTPPPAPGT